MSRQVTISDMDGARDGRSFAAMSLCTMRIAIMALLVSVIFVSMLASSPSTASAQDAVSIPDDPTPATSSPTAMVNIGFIDYSTYGYLDDAGFPRGYDVEYAQEIAQYARLAPTFKMYRSADEVYDALRSGEIDMVMDFSRIEQNQQEFIFSDYALNTMDSSVVARADKVDCAYGDVDAFKTMKFGSTEVYISSTGFDDWCATAGFTPDVALFDDDTELRNALDSGEVDAIVTPVPPVGDYRTILYFNPVESYVMFYGTNTELKSRIDAAMAQMLVEDPFIGQRLFSKYLDVDTDETPNLTTDELAYIEENPTLRVAVVSDDAPYYHVSDGTAEGIVVDYYGVIAAKTGFRIEYVECDDQTAVKDAVREGRADIVGIYGGDPLTAENEGLLRTSAYASQTGVRTTRAGWSGEVEKAAVVQRRASIIKLELTNNGQCPDLIAYPNNDACYEALESGEVDAIYGSLAAATWQINQHGSGKLSITAMPAVSLDISGAVVKDNYTLKSIIDHVAVNSEPDMQSIITRNSTSPDTLKSTIEKAPAASIIAFSALMIALVLCLAIALIMLIRRQKERAKVLADAAATEQERIRLEAVAKSAEEKNQFFSNISHDMRTPLNAIIGFSHLAESEHASPVVDDYLAKIDRSGALLLGLIDDTLTISKSNNGKLTLRPEPCLNSDIFNAIVVPITKSADDRSVILVTDRSRMKERAILADRVNVEKIALNLLSNAIRFTPSGSHVWFTMADDPEGSPDPDMLMTVRDEGIGMSEEFQDHLYEPFSQEMRTGYAGSGTGLGLSIVSQLVDLMGGTIRCESTQGEGTTFTVRIHFDTTETPLSEHAEPLAPIGLEEHRILLCEDNDLNAEIAIRLLGSKGMSVDRAENGQAGVEMFTGSEVGAYDAVLMDVRMPIMDGLCAARTIRGLDRKDAKAVPIIAMTADAFEDDVRRCREAGMDDHVSKPIDPERLFVALGAAIARRETTDTGTADGDGQG